MSMGYLGGEMTAGLINSTGKMLKKTGESIGYTIKSVDKAEETSKTCGPLTGNEVEFWSPFAHWYIYK